MLTSGLPGLIAPPHSQYIQRFTPRAKSCDPEVAMKIILCILAILIIAASLYADYKWRQWIANHPTDKDLSAGTPPARRRDRQ